MTAALPWVLALALAIHGVAHLAIVVGLARARAFARAALALVVPPLAAWWGWEARMRLRVIAWAASLAVYALGLAVA